MYVIWKVIQMKSFWWNVLMDHHLELKRFTIFNGINNLNQIRDYLHASNYTFYISYMVIICLLSISPAIII